MKAKKVLSNVLIFTLFGTGTFILEKNIPLFDKNTVIEYIDETNENEYVFEETYNEEQTIEVEEDPIIEVEEPKEEVIYIPEYTSDLTESQKDAIREMYSNGEIVYDENYKYNFFLNRHNEISFPTDEPFYYREYNGNPAYFQHADDKTCIIDIDSNFITLTTAYNNGYTIETTYHFDEKYEIVYVVYKNTTIKTEYIYEPNRSDIKTYVRTNNGDTEIQPIDFLNSSYDENYKGNFFAVANIKYRFPTENEVLYDAERSRLSGYQSYYQYDGDNVNYVIMLDDYLEYGTIFANGEITSYEKRGINGEITDTPTINEIPFTEYLNKEEEALTEERVKELSIGHHNVYDENYTLNYFYWEDVEHRLPGSGNVYYDYELSKQKGVPVYCQDGVDERYYVALKSGYLEYGILSNYGGALVYMEYGYGRVDFVTDTRKKPEPEEEVVEEPKENTDNIIQDFISEQFNNFIESVKEPESVKETESFYDENYKTNYFNWEGVTYRFPYDEEFDYSDTNGYPVYIQDINGDKHYVALRTGFLEYGIWFKNGETIAFFEYANGCFYEVENTVGTISNDNYDRLVYNENYKYNLFGSGNISYQLPYNTKIFYEEIDEYPTYYQIRDGEKYFVTIYDCGIGFGRTKGEYYTSGYEHYETYLFDDHSEEFDYFGYDDYMLAKRIYEQSGVKITESVKYYYDGREELVDGPGMCLYDSWTGVVKTNSGSGLKKFNGSTEDAEVIDNLPDGTEVTVLAEENGRFLVSYYSPEIDTYIWCWVNQGKDYCYISSNTKTK